MGKYRIAEICPNGHVSTDAADANPELREKFCSRCGEATMTHCPNCSVGIRGEYHVDSVVFLGNTYTPPAYCFNCGNAFEWTKRKIEGAVELLEADGVPLISVPKVPVLSPLFSRGIFSRSG